MLCIQVVLRESIHEKVIRKDKKKHIKQEASELKIPIDTRRCDRTSFSKNQYQDYHTPILSQAFIRQRICIGYSVNHTSVQ